MIIKGSDWFVEATIWIAKVFRVPNIIIGATLVSLCTTLPEAMVSTSSSLKGNPDIAFGNAIGSIACNTGLVLALTIILSKPAIKEKRNVFIQGVFLLSLLGFLTIATTYTGAITASMGNILLVCLGAYLLYNLISTKDAKKHQKQEKVDVSFKLFVENVIMFTIGLGLTIWGADLLVDNGEKIARLLGVSDVVIGLTLTAFGTSLPELVTSITAIMKKAHDISLGNVLGANILNIVLVVGLASKILPIPMQPEWISFQLPFVSLIVGMLVVYSLINKKNFQRWNGFLILGTYMVYLFFTIQL
jgi:cation:H+ antiporter